MKLIFIVWLVVLGLMLTACSLKLAGFESGPDGTKIETLESEVHTDEETLEDAEKKIEEIF